jgi:hypothetical protein
MIVHYALHYCKISGPLLHFAVALMHWASSRSPHNHMKWRGRHEGVLTKREPSVVCTPGRCEVCFALMVTREETICRRCDERLAAQQEVEFTKVADSWGARRRCRHCQRALRPSRYFECETCVKPSDRPSDDPLSEWADLDDAKVYGSGVKRPRKGNTRTPPGARVCPTCKQMKNIEEYSRDASAPDGHRHSCKTCMRAYARAYYAKNKNTQQGGASA